MDEGIYLCVIFHLYVVLIFSLTYEVVVTRF